jgi:hypothetical protein
LVSSAPQPLQTWRTLSPAQRSQTVGSISEGRPCRQQEAHSIFERRCARQHRWQRGPTGVRASTGATSPQQAQRRRFFPQVWQTGLPLARLRRQPFSFRQIEQAARTAQSGERGRQDSQTGASLLA